MSAFFPKMPMFDIEDRHYIYKHLGHKEVFTILALGKDVWSLGMSDFQMRLERFDSLFDASKLFSPQMATNISLLFGLEYTKGHLDDLFISITRKVDDKGVETPITQEDLDDAEMFPAYTLPLMLVKLIEHPDVSMFISAFISGAEIPFFQQLKKTQEKMQNTST